MGNKNRVAFFNILSTLVLNGISVFTAPLFSRMLGTSNYGVISVYGTWLSIVSIVFTLSVSATIANARVRFPEDQWDAYQSSILGMSCISYAGFSAIVLLFLKPISAVLQMDSRLIPMMLIQAFGASCIGFVTTRFGYEFKAGRNFAVSITVAVSTIVLSIVLIPRFPSNEGYLGRILALVIVYGLLGFLSCIYVFCRGRQFCNLKYWKFCLPLAIPFVFHSLSDLLLGHSDMLMLKHFGTDAMVGLYGLAYNFSTVLYTIWTSLNNSFSPFYYEYMRTGQTDELKKSMKNYAELFAVLACGFVLLQPEVYRVFASQDFWGGAVVIPLFVISYYFIFFTGVCVNYEVFHGKTAVMAVGTISACFTNIVLNYFLIRSYGIIGAALATMICHVLQAIYHMVVVNFIGKKGEFFGIIKYAPPYTCAFLLIVVMVFFTEKVWWLRWGLAAALGVWELRRVLKRKSIF